MEILLDRKYKLEDYTIGKLHINGIYFCDVLEDTDRGLLQDMPLAELFKMKKKGMTAIPRGRYQVKITWSPKYRRMMPILCNVPAYEGIRIHSGNTAEHTEGCLLLGQNKKKGMVLNSRVTCRKFEGILKKALEARKEEAWITIR